MDHRLRSEVSGALGAVIEGRVGPIVVLAEVSHSELLLAAADIGHSLVLTSEAVAVAVQSLLEKQAAPDACQLWASFVRRGYLSRNASSGAPPLHIEYERANEMQIVEAISRLDELGDIVDGEISDEEARKILRSLR